MVLHGHSHSLPLGARLVRPVQRLWGTASKAFAQHPFLIKTVSAGFGFAFGDVLFQLGTTRRKGLPLDWRRSAAMGGAGLAAAGPLGYYFIMWMEGNIMTAAPHRWAAGRSAGAGWAGPGQLAHNTSRQPGAHAASVPALCDWRIVVTCSPPCSRACSMLALGVKLTLDQVLGLALWHAALAAINEPHRVACLALAQQLAQQQQQQQRGRDKQHLLAASKAR